MKQSKAALVYPHQLWGNNPAVAKAKTVFLIEDPLFFTQYNFHCQKLILHRATMTEYATALKSDGKKVIRVESHEIAHSSEIGSIAKNHGVDYVYTVEPTDDWLRRRVVEGCQRQHVAIEWLDDPGFLTPVDVMQQWTRDRAHYHFTDFYRLQRTRLGLLLDGNGKPVGGKWTYDTDNRKKLPKGIEIPELSLPAERNSVREARKYVAKRFPNNLGLASEFIYPVTYEDSVTWLRDFVAHRLADFGDYEDAISQREAFVFHSVLTPMLNVGLITPQQVISAVLERCDEVSLNSMEGFVRQVIGWREFIRLVYMHAGSRQRTRNAWGLSRSIPKSFYDGTTGITPFDCSVKRVLKHAYCHHIERLMILGNFMLLCDIHPDAVYQWFMEMFIDSYDWVMVPNVYGMSQHADGGLMTTKPYISGSSYVCKMSDFPKGNWAEVWDGLYWRFVDRERAFFKQNPRMSVMVGQLDRMGAKLAKHHQVADRFLETMSLS